MERALPIWHETLGLIGKADMVEFEHCGAPYPVEYKSGTRHKASEIAAADDLQLAAQAMCLEEMTGCAVPEGAVYYARSKRRRVVAIDGRLRSEVARVTAAIREMLVRGELPPPTADERRCKECSLKDRCQPESHRKRQLADDLRAWMFDASS
jgi:CRISPR-associated exonuclease Cas4